MAPTRPWSEPSVSFDPVLAGVRMLWSSFFDEAVQYLTKYETTLTNTNAEEPNSGNHTNIAKRQSIDPGIFSQRATKGLCGYCGLER